MRGMVVAITLLSLACLIIRTTCLKIIILAFNRPRTLQRCLGHLLNANYPTGTIPIIPLEIRIDRDHDNVVDTKTLQVANSFYWPFGEKTIFIHPKAVGLQGQWLSIRPNDFSFILEDDIIVTRFYYKLIIKATSILSRKNKEEEEGIFAIALQKAQWQMGINEHYKWRRLNLVDKAHPKVFLFQAPATWAVLIIPDKWKAFLDWAFSFLADSNRKYSKGSITTKWIKERGEDKLISSLMFEYLLMTDLYIMNFWSSNEMALVISETILENGNDDGNDDDNNANASTNGADSCPQISQRYYNDTLLSEWNDYHNLLLSISRQTGHFQKYSACFDRISVVYEHCHDRGGYHILSSKDFDLKMKRFLVNVERKPRICVSKDEIPALTGAGSQSSMSLYANDDHKIKCPYSAGLYPHMIEDDLDY